MEGTICRGLLLCISWKRARNRGKEKYVFLQQFWTGPKRTQAENGNQEKKEREGARIELHTDQAKTTEQKTTDWAEP